MMNAAIVKKKLADIFAYRFRKVEELCGKRPGQEMQVTIK
jgi:hypothetical protein